jgi:hypothetical protein
MQRLDVFIKNDNSKFMFNGYAYESKDGIINLEINTIPFSKKLIIIKSSELFRVA